MCLLEFVPDYPKEHLLLLKKAYTDVLVHYEAIYAGHLNFFAKRCHFFSLCAQDEDGISPELLQHYFLYILILLHGIM